MTIGDDAHLRTRVVQRNVGSVFRDLSHFVKSAQVIPSTSVTVYKQQAKIFEFLTKDWKTYYAERREDYSEFNASSGHNKD